MSPEATAVNSFVGNLVEMAKAYETLPQVQHDLDQAKHDNATLADTISQREQRILSLKAEIEAQNERIRKLEAERDDAELRFLEADDKASKVLDMLRMGIGHILDARDALSPPKPEPTPVLEAVHSIEEAKPEQFYHEPPKDWGQPVDPLAEAPLHPAPQGEPIPGNGNGDPQGERAADPSTTTKADASVDYSPQTASHTEASASSAQSADLPYANCYYVDYPGYVSRYDWKAGGGTDETYDYRRPIDGAVI